MSVLCCVCRATECNETGFLKACFRLLSLVRSAFAVQQPSAVARACILNPPTKASGPGDNALKHFWKEIYLVTMIAYFPFDKRST